MSDIFKVYDIRGIYPDGLNEDMAFQIGGAFVKHTGAKKVVVGRDARNSSPQLADSIIKGLVAQNADVTDIGQIATDCLYFSLIKYGYEAGVMVTASHNPPNYNGFKMMKNENGHPAPINTQEIKEVIDRGIAAPEKKGTVYQKDIWQDYLDHIFSFVDIEKIKPFRIVVDASNGMAGKVVPQIKDRLPVEILGLNFKLDGNFPSHSPNPLEKESISQISEKIKIEKADFGFIFDGDADRVFLVSKEGKLVPADVTLLLLARYFLKNHPGEAVVYNLTCSKAIPEFIEKWGGCPVRSPVGYINIWNNMKKNKAVLGGETSGHYAFRDNFYSDSGFIAFLVLLEILSRSEKGFSEQNAELRPYVKIPETNLEISDKEKVIKRIEEKFSDGKQDKLDGLTVWYEDWWFNLRASRTEPVLRINIEADNQQLLEEKKELLFSFIKEISEK